MTRAIAVALVLIILAGAFVPTAVAQDTGDALLSDDEDLPETEDGETIISGLDDDELSLIGVEYSEGVVELEIRADSAQTIQVLDAFGSGGDAATILRPESRSLSEGVNSVDIEAESINGVAVINVQGDGDTAQIPVDAGRDFSLPPTDDVVAWGAGLSGALIVFGGLAYTKRRYAGQEKDRRL